MMSLTVRFSNTLKTPITVQDGSINIDTSLGLIGRNASNYGETLATNFLHLLENFSKDTQPDNPIEGQLWYDVSDPSAKILKVYDGANFVPANGVHQSSTAPTSKKIGDIWVDTLSSQLNIWTGNQWLLIGPTSSGGGRNGSFASSIIGSDGNTYNIVATYVNDEVITITAQDQFIPNPVITGFTELVPGLNVSTQQFNGITARLGGLADTALSLKVTGSVDPVSADYFLRSDTAGKIDGILTINANQIRVGAITQTVLIEKQGTKAVFSNRSNAGDIQLSVLKNNVLNPIVTVNGNYQRVGINNISPTVDLDVTGTGKFSGKLSINSSAADALTVAGGTVISGNATVAGHLRVTQNSSFTATVYVGDLTATSPSVAIEPNQASLFDLGSSSMPFRKVYADEFLSTSVAFSMIPTGGVILFGGATLPSGFLECDGSSKSATDYPRLYAVISTSYGSASAGNFNVPSLAGLVATNPNVNVTLRYIIKY